MNKQITPLAFCDELVNVRTKKKSIPCTDRAHYSVREMGRGNQSALLQFRYVFGTIAYQFHDCIPVRSGGYTTNHGAHSCVRQ